MIRAVAIACAFVLAAGSASGQVSACAACHAGIAATFAKTGMGRSFSRMTAEPFAEKPYYHEPSDSYFRMLVRDGRVYQRRWQVDPSGKETNVDEKQVDFVMGSANHAKTYLRLTPRGALQQLPLGWYAEQGGVFAMNPGYDRPDYPGSTRAISYECMACHNGYPKIPAANRDEGAEARYLSPLPEGIDCQRCHGDGREHIATSGRAAVVNPAKLTPARAMEVCMQCHLETSSRLMPHSIQKHGRAPFSYTPGQPLSDFMATFDRAAGQNTAVEVAGGAYRFRQSLCFTKSAGKLSCTTCHNPHDVPRGEAAVAHYNQVCTGCHVESHRKTENCVGCHMPKTRTDDAVHIVITDHRIQRGPVAPSQLIAEKAEAHETPATSYRGPVVPYYPAKAEPLYEAVAQTRDGSNLQAGLPKLASLMAQQKAARAGFWVDLGEAYRAAGDPAGAARAFEEALARSPESPVILLKLGNLWIESRQWAKAEAVLHRATVRAPNDGLAWGLLGWALWQEEKRAEGRAALEKAVRLEPEVPELRNYLGGLLAGAGDRAGAAREFREAVRLSPGIAEWRANLAGMLAAGGEIPEARYHFEEALRFKPEYAQGRFDYARLLAAIGEMADAEKHAKLSVESDASNPGAHELWGALMAARRDYDGAQRELELAVKLAPGFAKAQYELGMVLYSKGETAAAIEHLRKGDADAAAFLKSIGK